LSEGAKAQTVTTTEFARTNLKLLAGARDWRTVWLDSLTSKDSNFRLAGDVAADTCSAVLDLKVQPTISVPAGVAGDGLQLWSQRCGSFSRDELVAAARERQGASANSPQARLGRRLASFDQTVQREVLMEVFASGDGLQLFLGPFKLPLNNPGTRVEGLRVRVGDEVFPGNSANAALANIAFDLAVCVLVGGAAFPIRTKCSFSARLRATARQPDLG
jgi:hypothetical protein